MQKTLTIEEIDPETFERLTQEANRRGLAVSSWARTVLEQSLASSPEIYHDLDSLMGTWTEEDAASFGKSTTAMRAIDAELW